MATLSPATQRIHGYCALCVSRCGSIAIVEDGRFSALEPDPSHPTGRALCAKGRAAPELVYHEERLLHPVRRTRPKDDPDPGWERISWDEALDITAARLRSIADESGPESVVISLVSPSTSASDDAFDWVHRLAFALGTPNICGSVELCGWGRYFATLYTFGTSVPGIYMPDLESAGCILYWGYNPNLARLSHATATVDALKRGARLVVVDPRRVGPATRADRWLQVRPGTDAALALGLAHVLLERGWYDRDFVRDWTNGPLLVGDDDGRLLTERDLGYAGSPPRYLAWDTDADEPVALDPALPATAGPGVALQGTFTIDTPRGPVACRPVFERLVESCRAYPPDVVEGICGVAAADVEAAAELLWQARPVAYYAWSGVEMQTGATQIARAIAQLSILTGSFDVPGGNVRFGSVPTNDIDGRELLSAEQVARTLGREERPLGPARFGYVTTDELYRAILEHEPYRVRGLIGFGANLLLAHADPRRGRQALQELDFYVHADLFMNPTAECADIVLPVASAFEREGLRVGFEISAEAQQHVQLRPRVVEPRGEARSDNRIIFDLARHLGLGAHFWDGDEDAANDHLLAPSGLTVEQLRAAPGGVRVPVPTHYRKYAEEVDGAARGFETPSRLIELYSERLLQHGYPPLPSYEEPLVGPRSRPDLAARYPLVLTCAKHTLYCETQHRALPSLRRKSLGPEVELHPDTAARRGIEDGAWVIIETPEARVRAQARLVATLRPDVVSGQHGWWQACEVLEAPGFDAFGEDGANYNLLIGNDAIDPVSGSVPHRAYLCEVRLDG
jgi:anaerobic selenocysteine-containing dehydrogenase